MFSLNIRKQSAGCLSCEEARQVTKLTSKHYCYIAAAPVSSRTCQTVTDLHKTQAARNRHACNKGKHFPFTTSAAKMFKGRLGYINAKEIRVYSQCGLHLHRTHTPKAVSGGVQEAATGVCLATGLMMTVWSFKHFAVPVCRPHHLQHARLGECIAPAMGCSCNLCFATGQSCTLI